MSGPTGQLSRSLHEPGPAGAGLPTEQEQQCPSSHGSRQVRPRRRSSSRRRVPRPPPPPSNPQRPGGGGDPPLRRQPRRGLGSRHRGRGRLVERQRHQCEAGGSGTRRRRRDRDRRDDGLAAGHARSRPPRPPGPRRTRQSGREPGLQQDPDRRPRTRSQPRSAGHQARPVLAADVRLQRRTACTNAVPNATERSRVQSNYANGVTTSVVTDGRTLVDAPDPTSADLTLGQGDALAVQPVPPARRPVSETSLAGR